MFFHLQGDITVQSLTANFVLDEELTHTCISTGGPATTVTWTRDSKKIGGMTVLNDATSAWYTHTLTMTERLEGLYQCTVLNNKPSNDSKNIHVNGRVRMHCHNDITAYYALLSIQSDY